MPDTRDSRDKQAHDEANRQRMRAMLEELERGDETEPPVTEESLDDLDADLETVEFPATGRDLVATVGESTVESPTTTYTVAELLPESDDDSYDSAATVRERVRRPTTAGAMKRIVEAVDASGSVSLDAKQREGYERTFRELIAIDAVDDDEGVTAVADWIVDRIESKGKLPGSRDVRRQAAKVCRANGYVVRDDEWLGI